MRENHWAKVDARAFIARHACLVSVASNDDGENLSVEFAEAQACTDKLFSMLVMTEKHGVCWHCHQPIAFFRPTQQSWVEANGAQRLRLSERWMHTDEEQAYGMCKVNGFHPGAGTTLASASPQSSLVKIGVTVTIVVMVLLAFLVYAYSGAASVA